LDLQVANFQTGVECSGGATQTYGLNSCVFANNGTGLFINNATVECNSCIFLGAASLASTPVNTGLLIDGSQALCLLSGGACITCATGFQVQNNANATLSSITFTFNTFDIVQTSGSTLALTACNFELNTGASDIDMQVSGAGTTASIVGCYFDGNNSLGAAEGIALAVTAGGTAGGSCGRMINFVTAVQAGAMTDTSSTQVFLSSLVIRDSTTLDIEQQGSATLTVEGSTLSSS